LYLESDVLRIPFQAILSSVGGKAKKVTPKTKEVKMERFYFFLVTLFSVNGAIAQWVQQNSGTTNTLNSVYFTEVNTGYAVGDSGTILKTMDGGSNWQLQNSGVSSSLNSVYFYDSNTGYTVGDSGTILKTTNGGILWTNQFTDILKGMNSIYFTNIDTGYIVGDQDDTCYILKTINGGNLWSIIYTYCPQQYNYHTLNSVHFPETNTGYCVGTYSNGLWTSGHVLKTTNGGADWTVQLVGGVLKSVYFLNPDTGYVVGHISGIKSGPESIARTTDGGLNWHGCDTVWYYPFHFNSVYFTDANTGYSVGSDNWSNSAIIKTLNGGIDWTIYDSLIANYLGVLMSVHFPAKDTGYIVGRGGAILKTTNGGGGLGIDDHYQATSILTLSPNPASTNITIETPTKGFIYINNLSGQQLLQQEIIEAKTTIDVRAMSSGVYSIKLVDENGVHTGKIIKI
jgi:photosystem II stability/assembly factor-like uncharacterized protein